MIRGGGGGGGMGNIAAQFLAMLQQIGAIPPDDLMRLIIGLLLVAAIFVMWRRLPATTGTAVPPSTTCLVCGKPLRERVYQDRHLPTWVACGECYDQLAPARQRQYRPRA